MCVACVCFEVAQGGDSHEACSVSDPLLSLWGGAVTVIGLPDAASCDPESCSCPCLLCLGGMVLGGVYMGCCGTGV